MRHILLVSPLPLTIPYKLNHPEASSFNHLCPKKKNTYKRKIITMAIKNNVFFIILVLMMTCHRAYATESRSYDLNNNNMNNPNLGPCYGPDSGQAYYECFKAIQGLNSCSNLIAKFFTVSRSDIAQCCSAIDRVTSECSSWPDANTYTDPLPAFGYTDQELDMLVSYCSRASSPAASSAPAPALAPNLIY